MTVIHTNSAIGVLPESCHKHIICWSSVLTGTITALAISFVLLILASSYGLAISSPWSGEGFSAQAVGVNAIIALIVIQWISSGFGGYLATRFRRGWGFRNCETISRDMVHGFLTWAVATLVTAVLLGSTVGSIAMIGAHGAATGAAISADHKATGNDPLAYSIDTLFRSTRPPTTDISAPETRAEVTRLLAKSVSDEKISDGDRTYLAGVVANRTGISQGEAEARIDTVIKETKENIDSTRKTAATVALFTFLSLAIGAFIGAISGVLGGHCRDECEIV